MLSRTDLTTKAEAGNIKGVGNNSFPNSRFSGADSVLNPILGSRIESLRSASVRLIDVREALAEVGKTPSSKNSLEILNAISENPYALGYFRQVSLGVRESALTILKNIAHAEETSGTSQGYLSESKNALASILRISGVAYSQC
jgi:hypothetical protein